VRILCEYPELRRYINPMRSFGVPGATLGYLFQLRYALILFLRAVREIGPTVELSMERTDDIEIGNPSAESTITQTKHHESGSTLRVASLTDSSPDVWKTLRIWSEAVSTGTIRIRDTLLHLVTTAVASPGTACSMLRPYDRDVTTALQKLRAVASTSRSQDNVLAYAAFSQLPEDGQRTMLEQIRILDGSPNVSDLNVLLARELITSVDETHMPAFTNYIEGWWVDRAIAHLRASRDDRISGLELIQCIQEVQRHFREDSLPVDDDLVDAAFPTTAEDERRMFVRQLRLIGLHHNGLLVAIQDYYRAYTQRSRWARNELLFVNELERYERRLIDEWKHAFTLMESTCPEDDAGRCASGMSLYWDLSQRHMPIRASCTDGFIARGSLHMLADELRIGWHVDFVDRLRELQPV
jgi:hypothetical protein